MDHEIGRETFERRGKVARGVIQLRVLQVQVREEDLPSLRMPARGDDLHRGRPGEPAATRAPKLP